jgi:hypothetical protein
LSLTALGAMAVKFVCAVVLVRYRHQGGSLAKAAFLSARNDVYRERRDHRRGRVDWILRLGLAGPDHGHGIAALNAGAARKCGKLREASSGRRVRDEQARSRSASP